MSYLYNNDNHALGERGVSFAHPSLLKRKNGEAAVGCLSPNLLIIIFRGFLAGIHFQQYLA
jgi:hypothetical protein